MKKSIRRAALSLSLFLMTTGAFGTEALQVSLVLPQTAFTKKDTHIVAQVSVKNISHQEVKIKVMDCSYPQHFKTDNKIIKVIMDKDCLKNTPVVINLKPGETYTNKLSLVIDTGAIGTRTFKLSFTPYNEAEVWTQHNKDGSSQKIQAPEDKAFLHGQFWSGEYAVNIAP